MFFLLINALLAILINPLALVYNVENISSNPVHFGYIGNSNGYNGVNGLGDYANDKYQAYQPDFVNETIPFDPSRVFAGISFTGWTPSDAIMTVSSDRIILMVNGGISLMNKQTFTKLDNKSLLQFWSSSGGFDPKATFDIHTRRFVLCMVDGTTNTNSWVRIAISKTENPNTLTSADFAFYSIDADNGKQVWGDYPTMGVDNFYIYISTNNFGGGGFVSSQILRINKNIITNPGSAIEFTRHELGEFTMQPSTNWDKTIGFIPVRSGATKSLNFYYFAGAGTAGVALKSVTASILDPWRGGYGPAPQLGSTYVIDTADLRLINSFTINKKLYTVHTIKSESGLKTDIRWYEFDLSSGMPLIHSQGDITHSSLYFYHPSITANANGDVGLVFGGSDSSTYPSMYIASRYKGIWTSPVKVQGGSSSYQYNISRNRWGDYSGAVTDPVDGSFWFFHQVSSGINRWDTYGYHLAFECECKNGGVCSTSNPLNITVSGNFTDISHENNTADGDVAGVCICPKGYIGVFCEELDTCKPGCQNGGVCFLGENEGDTEGEPKEGELAGVCVCPVGYSGTFCEIRSCTLTCQNSGSCKMGVTPPQDTCVCVGGYTGAFCEIPPVRQCSLTCLNGGACKLGATAAQDTCLCIGGFTGTRCEIPPTGKTCVDDPTLCKNKGVCLPSSTNPRCICLKGFGGVYCEQGVGACNPNPCLNGGNCKESTAVPPGPNVCVCAGEYTGPKCEIPPVRQCTLQCQNGGTCQLDGAVQKCVCLDGFGGAVCEIKCFSKQYGSGCINGGICTEVSPKANKCVCLENYDGIICERKMCSPECINGVCHVAVSPSSPSSANTKHAIDHHVFKPNKESQEPSESAPGVCICQEGWKGEACDTKCGLQCQNGGTCKFNGDFGQEKCNCIGDFHGKLCEFKLDSCLGDNLQCKHGGVCDVDKKMCICPPEFYGDMCQHFCMCLNNATCSGDGGCLCKPGFTGEYCEKDPNCPCKNGGICFNEYGVSEAKAQTCICKQGFCGQTCAFTCAQYELIQMKWYYFVYIFSSASSNPASSNSAATAARQIIITFNTVAGNTTSSGENVNDVNAYMAYTNVPTQTEYDYVAEKQANKRVFTFPSNSADGVYYIGIYGANNMTFTIEEVPNSIPSALKIDAVAIFIIIICLVVLNIAFIAALVCTINRKPRTPLTLPV